MLNQEHQNLASIRRSEGPIDIAGHIRKEEILRQQLESERASKRELVEKLNAEKDEIRLKTKHVVELFKSKLATTESELQNQAKLHGVLEKRQAIANELLGEHLTKWKCWNSYLQQSNGVDKFAEYLIGQPMRFISSAEKSSEITIENFSDIPELMISELDTIISLSRSAAFSFSQEDVTYVTVRPIFHPSSATDVKQAPGKGKELGSPARRRPLLELDMNSAQPALARISSGDVIKAAMSPACARSTAVPPPLSATKRSISGSSAAFAIYGGNNNTRQPDGGSEDAANAAIVVELQTKLAAQESAALALQDRCEALNSVLTSERVARSALEATAAEVPNLQLTVQKLEGKVVKLKSSLDKSRAEALNLRETLQREQDVHFNLQLRHTSEKEAFAASAATAALAQEQELDRLRAIVAAPNAPLLALEARLLRAQAESSEAKGALAESAQVLQAFQDASVEREKVLQDQEALLRSEHAVAVQALEDELRSLREQVETAMTSATESDVAGAVLRGQLEMQRLCLTEAQNSNSAVQVRLAQSEREVEQLQEDIRSKAEAMDALLELMRCTEQAFTAERAKLQEDSNERCAALSGVCDELRAQVEASAVAVSALQNELTVVREQAFSAECAHQQQVQELRAELSERLQQLKAAEEAAREERLCLAETLRSKQSSSVEKETALSAEIAALLVEQENDRLQLRDATAASSNLAGQLRELEAALAAAQADLQARGERESELSNSLAIHKEEVSRAGEMLAEQVDVTANIKSKLGELEVTCADLRSHLQKCETERLAAVECAESLEREKGSLQACIQEAELHIAARDEEIERTKLTLAQALDQLALEQNAHEEAKAQLVALHTEHTSALAELSAALRDLEESQSQSETLAGHLRDALVRSAVLEASVQGLAQQILVLKDDVVRLQAALAAREEECVQIESCSRQAADARDLELQQLRAEWEDKLEFWSEKWMITDRQLQEQRSDAADSSEELLRAQQELSQMSEGAAMQSARIAELEKLVAEKDREISAAQLFAGEESKVLSKLNEELMSEKLASAEMLAKVDTLEAELVKGARAQDDLEALVHHLGGLVLAAKSERDALRLVHDEEMSNVLHGHQTALREAERKEEAAAHALQEMTERCSVVSAELATVRRVMTEKGDALLSVVEASRDRIAALESQLESSQARIAALESELGVSRTSVTALTSDLESYRARIASLEAHLQESQTTVAALRSQLEASQATIVALRLEGEGSRARIASLASELEVLRASMAALETEMCLERTACAEAALAHGREAEAFARQSQERDENMHRIAAEAAAEASALHFRIEELQTELERLRQECDIAVLAVRAERDQQCVELAALHARALSTLSSEHEKRVDELNSEVDSLSSSARELALQVAAATSMASALQDERDALLASASERTAAHATSLHSAEALVSELQGKLAAADCSLESAKRVAAEKMERLMDEHAASGAALAYERKHATDLECELHTSAQEAAELQTVLQDLRAQHADLFLRHEKVTTNLVALKEEFARAEATLREQSIVAQLQWDVLNEAIGDISTELLQTKQGALARELQLAAEIAEKAARLSATTKSLKATTIQLDEKAARVTALEGALATAQAELGVQTARSAALDDVVVGLRSQLGEAQATLSLAQAELSAAEGERDDLAAMVAQQEAQLNNSALRCDQLSAELASALESSGTHAQHLSEQLSLRCDETAQLRNHVAQLESQLGSKTVEISSLLDARAKVDEELAEAARMSQNLQDQLNEAVEYASAADAKHAVELAALSEALTIKEGEFRHQEITMGDKDRELQILQQSHLQYSAELEATIMQLRCEADEQRRSLEHLQRHAEDLETLCARAARELTVLRCSLEEKVAQIATSEEISDDLLAEMFGVRKAAAERERTNATTIANLRSNLTLKEAELQSAVRAADEERRVLTDRVAETREEAQRLTAQNVLLNTTIAQGEQRARELEEKIKTQRVSGDILQTALAEKAADVAELTSQLRILGMEKTAQDTVITGLRTRSEEDQASITSLKELVSSQIVKLGVLEGECQDSETRAVTLRDELKSVQDRLDALLDAHAQLVLQCAEIEQQRDAYQQKVEDQEQALLRAEGNISTLEDELEAMSSARCAESSEYLTQLKEREFALAKLQEQHSAGAQVAAARLVELEAQLQEITDARDADSVTYIAELDRRNAAVSSLEEAIQRHIQHTADLTAEIEKERAAKSDIIAEKSAIVEELAAAKQAVAATEAALVTTRTELGAEQERAREAAAAAEWQQAEARSALAALQEALHAKGAELAAALESLDAHQTATASALAAAQAEVCELTQQLTSLRQEHEAACSQVREQQCALQEYRQELALQLSKLAEEQEARQSESVSFTAQMRTKLEDAARTESRLEEQCALVSSLREEIAASKDALVQVAGTAATERCTLQNALEDMQAAHSASSGQVSELTVQCESIQADLDAARVELQASRTRIAELSASVEQISTARDVEIRDIAQQLSDCESELAAAQALVASLELTLSGTAASLVSSQAALADLKCELSSAQDNNTAKETELAAVTAEMRGQLDALCAAEMTLQESLRATEGRESQLRGALAESRASLDAAQTDISTLQRRIEDLASRSEETSSVHVAEMLNLATLIAAGEASNQVLQQEVSQQQARIAELQRTAEESATSTEAAATSHAAAVQALQGQLGALAEHNQQLAQDVSACETTIEQLRAFLQDSEIKLAQLAEDKARQTQELYVVVAELEAERAVLVELNYKHSREVASHEAAMEASRAELQELAQRLAEQEQLSGQLAQKVAEQEVAVAQLRAELAEGGSEMAALRIRLQEQTEAAANLTVLLDQLQRDHVERCEILSTQLAQNNEELDAARAKCAQQQALVANMKAEQEELHTQAESAAQAHAFACTELQQEVEAMKDTERQLVEAIFAHEHTITEMKEALAQGETEHIQLLKVHEELLARAEDMEQRAVDLADTTTRLESQVSAAAEIEQALQARCSALDEEVSAAHKEVTNLTASTVHAQLLFTEATAEIAALQAKYDDICLVAYKHHQSEEKLSAEIANVREECTVLRADVADREADLEDARETAKELEQHLEKQKTEHNKAQVELLQQLSSKADELDAASASTEILQHEIHRLSAELEAMAASSSQRESALAALKTNLQARENLLAELQAAKQQASEAMSTERAEYETRIASLEQNLDESEFVAKELNDVVENLKLQLQASVEDSGMVTIQLQATLAQLAEHEVLVEQLRADMVESDQATTRLRKQLDESGASHFSEKERIMREFTTREAHLTAELQEKSALVDAMEKSRRALSRELEEARKRLEELRNEQEARLHAHRELEYTAQESASRAQQLDHALASMREVAEVQSNHYHAERDAHLREVQHLKDSLREKEHVAQELNVRLLSVMEGSDDNRRRAHEMDVAYRKVYEAKLAATAELEVLQEEHAVLIAQEHLRSKEITDLRERLHQSEAVLVEVRQQLASRSAWSAELSSTFQQSQETVMKLATELAAKEAKLAHANASLTAVAAEVRNFEEVNLKLDIQAQGLNKALQELRGKLAEQERTHTEAKKSLESRLAAAEGKAEENEFVILELNARLEEESSLVFELEARLMERSSGGPLSPVAEASSQARLAAAQSASEEVEVLTARIQLLDEHVSDLEVQLQARSAEYDLLLSEARDKDEVISSLQRQLDALHECQTPEATRTEYSRREAELRDALAQHYELHVKSLQEKLSTAEALLATTQLELQQYHESHPEPEINESPDSSVVSLDPEEVRSLQQSLLRLRTKVASKSKQILLLNQQMLRDRQNFQKLKRSLVKLDSLKSTVFANNCNPVVAPPLPVHQVSELYHLGMEEGEKKVRQQQEAQLVMQEEEVKAIQTRLQSALSAIVVPGADPKVDGRSEAAVLDARVTALRGELDQKLAAQLALLRQVEELRERRSEAEAGHYLALSKSKMECAALRKTVEDLQSRVFTTSDGSAADGEGTAAETEGGMRAQLEAALVELQVQKRLQQEQETKFARAVRTLKALEARSQALGEQCVAANAEIAALTQQIATLRS